MFVVVMSTTWWAASLKSADDRRLFDEAVADIQWVIEQILGPSPAHTTPGVTQDLSPTPGPQIPPPPVVSWQVRGEGKRRPKPTTKLLEGLN
jgi:hypothetical protein